MSPITFIKFYVVFIVYHLRNCNQLIIKQNCLDFQKKKLNNFIFHAFCLFLFSTNDGGQATFDHNIYSTLHGGGMPFHGGGMHKSSKNSSAALSALTLLAFLFFLNLLQSCMKEHITAMHPTVRISNLLN